MITGSFKDKNGKNIFVTIGHNNYNNITITDHVKNFDYSEYDINDDTDLDDVTVLINGDVEIPQVGAATFYVRNNANIFYEDQYPTTIPGPNTDPDEIRLLVKDPSKNISERRGKFYLTQKYLNRDIYIGNLDYEIRLSIFKKYSGKSDVLCGPLGNTINATDWWKSVIAYNISNDQLTLGGYKSVDISGNTIDFILNHNSYSWRFYKEEKGEMIPFAPLNYYYHNPENEGTYVDTSALWGYFMDAIFQNITINQIMQSPIKTVKLFDIDCTNTPYRIKEWQTYKVICLERNWVFNLQCPVFEFKPEIELKWGSWDKIISMPYKFYKDHELAMSMNDTDYAALQNKNMFDMLMRFCINKSYFDPTDAYCLRVAYQNYWGLYVGNLTHTQENNIKYYGNDPKYYLLDYEEYVKQNYTYLGLDFKDLRIGVLGQNIDGYIAWASDPITIEENIDDPTTHIIKKNATLRFVTSKYVGNVFYKYGLEDVMIFTEDEILFMGYIEPYTYSQPFANLIEEIEINCIDCLSTLQYYKYVGPQFKNIANTPSTYSGLLTNMDSVSFYQILEKCISVNNGVVNPDEFNTNRKWQNNLFNGIDIWYDCSKQTSSSSLPENIFKELSISESYLYGEDWDDCMTFEECLDNMLKYLNLHIKQDGDKWYIFDWDSLKGEHIIWYSYLNNVKYNHRLPQNIISVSKSAANDANITIGEVYSGIQLTCDLDENEDIIQSPMDEETISSLWPTKQFYCREYLLEHKNDKSAFTTLVRDQKVKDRTYTLTDWYIQPLYSKYWKFNTHDGQYLDLMKHDGTGRFYKAADILSYAKSHYFTPVLLNVTKVENPTKREDNNVEYKAERSTQLYITINGNQYINAEVGTSNLPTDSQIQNYNSPIAEYESPKGGTIFSPADSETTNYLVFSGKIMLIPNKFYSPLNSWLNYLDDEGIRMSMAYTNTWTSGLSFGGNSMYGRRFFDLTYPEDKPVFNQYIANPNMILKGMHLSATDKDYKGEFFKYNWTAANDRDNDRISKIPLLACELIIGNKRLIEYAMDSNGNSKFKWVKIGEEPTEYDKDDKAYYKITTFSLGVNPKIGDFIVGTDFDMQNTVTFDMNLGDEKGIAIPIKQSDNLSGRVTFRILGVYNITWNDVIYRHGTWFRKKKWTDNYKEILPKLRSICLSDFSCKIFSDNGKIELIGDDNDLVYISDENDGYIRNVRDDLEFKFITQPTTDECREKGLKNSVYNNSVMTTKGSETSTLQSIFNAITHETAKPEEHYIAQYYKEFSKQRMIINHTVHDIGAIPFSHYYSKLLNKDFYIFNKTYNVLDNTYSINLREHDTL